LNDVLSNVEPIAENFSLKDRIYDQLKSAITSTNIYQEGANLRLDERQLADQLATSRTPIREALARLEQEGLVRIVPRKGVYIVRKTKAEIIEMIHVWAALESMAARLAAERASNAEITALRDDLNDFTDGEVLSHIDEYSEANIHFHLAIIDMAHSPLLRQIAENLFVHIRGIRAKTIGDADRATRSVIDHGHIVEALEHRDADLAERRVREHALELAEHVEANVAFID